MYFEMNTQGNNLIGCYVTMPTGDGPAGTIMGHGNNMCFLGNEVTLCGAPNSSNLYHPFYIQGPRRNTPPRLPTVYNRELAWNYCHDNRSALGIHMYNEQLYGSYMAGHNVHHNFCMNEQGTGIDMGAYLIGDNWCWNNVIVRCGIGGNPKISQHAGLQIATGGVKGDPAGMATMYVYNNTIWPLAVVARSPFGGGETADSYWPKGMQPELLRKLLKPLTGSGFKVALPEGAASTSRPGSPPAPWPKVGLPAPEEYEFVLLIGLHHETVPASADGTDGGEDSRVTAWAILYQVRTAGALWGTTAVACVPRRAEDPIDVPRRAAEAALGQLDFHDMGADNIPDYIRQLPALKGLPLMDAAAMLVQTQRPDAILAVAQAVKAASNSEGTIVQRYCNQAGSPVDHRLANPLTSAPGDWPEKLTPARVRVSTRKLLLEQLRGMKATWASVSIALIPQAEDPGLAQLGLEEAGLTPPIGPDDELVLIAELAYSDPLGVFNGPRRGLPHTIQAIRNLGCCRWHIDLARDVARFYAERKIPPPTRARPVAPFQAGQEAYKMLTEAQSRPSPCPAQP